MIVLYIVILIYFNFNITSTVNVFMLNIEKKNVSSLVMWINKERVEKVSYWIEISRK